MHEILVVPTGKIIGLSEEEFEDKFKLVLNHFYENPEDCSFNGCLFETFGSEVMYIMECAKNPDFKGRIWTIVEDDNGLYYNSGFHYVNRYGYLITEEAVEDGIEYIVSIEECQG